MNSQTGGDDPFAPRQASTPSAPPGWYPVEGGERYWDGELWTDDIRPVGGPHPVAGSSAQLDVSSEDVVFAVLIHLSALFGWFIVPLVLWLIRRGQSTFVDDHGKTAMNFQITYFVAFVVFGILSIVLIGLPFLLVTAIAYFVLPIVGAIKAGQRELWEYPLVVRIFN